VDLAYGFEVIPASGATFQVTFQFALFCDGQLPKHVWTEELLEAIFTHREPPSVLASPWPAGPS